VFVQKNGSGMFLTIRFFISPYCCPRLLLHGLHAGARLCSSCVPPLSASSMWSAVVAGAPHIQHGGLSRNSSALLSRYSLLFQWPWFFGLSVIVGYSFVLMLGQGL